MAASSAAAAQTFKVGLYDVTGKTLLANVDIPVPMPAIVQYQGNYYAYSPFISSAYTQQVPYVAQADLGAPALSVVAFPQY